MTRKELYNEVKMLNLQDEIKKATGRNFTQVPNNILEDFISLVKAGMENKKKKKPAKKTEKAEVECPMCKLIEVLVSKHIILPSEANYIMN